MRARNSSGSGWRPTPPPDCRAYWYMRTKVPSHWCSPPSGTTRPSSIAPAAPQPISIRSHAPPSVTPSGKTSRRPAATVSVGGWAVRIGSAALSRASGTDFFRVTDRIAPTSRATSSSPRPAFLADARTRRTRSAGRSAGEAAQAVRKASRAVCAAPGSRVSARNRWCAPNSLAGIAPPWANSSPLARR
ncbi:hypothetical protein [Streptomyces tanashiensis]|uniref:hypothetical protein n=1 Tax=Streptomyces tanashiensis TaxID=67367 RepID=UPI001E536FC9|nr:hypothetical protein [Streptomyces tanashiensis]